MFQASQHIKPVLDASADKVPYAISMLLNAEAKSVNPKLDPIVLYPISRANYNYVNTTDDRRSLNNFIRSTLKSVRHDLSPELYEKGQALLSEKGPSALGFQYAMKDDVLYNSILFHELGHSIWHISEETDDWYPLNTKISKELYDATGTAAGHEDERFMALREILLKWCQELFCDLYAVCSAGPQYIFAARDLIGVVPQRQEFNDTHPSAAFRQEQMLAAYKSCGWSAAVDQFPHWSERVDTLSGIDAPDRAGGALGGQQAGTIRKKFVFRSTGVQLEETDGPLLHRLLADLCSEVQTLAQKSVPGATTRPDEFRRLAGHVADALNRGIVPSSLVLEEVDSPARVADIQVESPHPVIVMNVARFLLETGCKDLLANWNMRESKAHARRKLLHRRLCQWTDKAIFDWSITHLA